MQKSIVFIFSCIVVLVRGQLLPGLPGTLLPGTLLPLPNYCAINPLTGAINFLAENVAYGVQVTVLGEEITVGSVSIPCHMLCQVTSMAGLPEMCRLCDIDCRESHNATSGSCVANASFPDGNACICDYAPPPGGIRPSISSHCGSWTATQDIVDTSAADTAIDNTVAKALKIRMMAAVCGAEALLGANTCRVESQSNHLGVNGTCTHVPAGFDDYCLISYPCVGYPNC